MTKRWIGALLLFGLVTGARAETNFPYAVWTDGVTLYWLDNITSSVPLSFRLSSAGIDFAATDSFGCMRLTAAPDVTAASVVVTNGTIASGTVTNTRTIDGVYLDVQESGKWILDFTFVAQSGHPELLYINGRYDGNPSHEVKLRAWDFANTTWRNFTSNAKDLPDSSTDQQYVFTFPEEHTNMVASGVSTVRIEHVSSASAGDHVYIDRISILPAHIHFPTAGVWTTVGNLTADGASNMVVDATAGTMRPLVTGWYELYFGGSGTGTGLTTFMGRGTTNNVDTGCAFQQYVAVTGKTENASEKCRLRVKDTNTVFRFQMAVDRPDSFATFVKFTVLLERIAE